MQVHVHTVLFYYFQMQLVKGKPVMFSCGYNDTFSIKEDMSLLDYNMACFAHCL